jgi:hypothetical protein
MSLGFNPTRQIAAFLEAYRAGEFSVFEYGVARTRDVHDLYLIFCDARKEPAYGLAPFVTRLVSDHPVYLLRKSYKDGLVTVGPHGLLVLAPFKNPRHGDELADYGNRVSAFQAMVRSLRNQHERRTVSDVATHGA